MQAIQDAGRLRMPRVCSLPWGSHRWSGSAAGSHLTVQPRYSRLSATGAVSRGTSATGATSLCSGAGCCAWRKRYRSTPGRPPAREGYCSGSLGEAAVDADSPGHCGHHDARGGRDPFARQPRGDREPCPCCCLHQPSRHRDWERGTSFYFVASGHTPGEPLSAMANGAVGLDHAEPAVVIGDQLRYGACRGSGKPGSHLAPAAG